MATESIRVSAVFPVSPERIYEAWLDSAQHTQMTGGGDETKATAAAEVGAEHSAWSGYIRGVNRELEPGRRIVQTWHAQDFPAGAEPSVLEVLLEPEGEGTRVTLVHSDLPEGMGKAYEEGWHAYYFEPMRSYFAVAASEGDEGQQAAPRRAEKSPAKRAASKGAAKKTAAKKPAAKKGRKPAAKKPAASKARKPAKKAPAKGARKPAKKAPAKGARKPAKKARRG
jgi:uncharacterized protein YndB with AHSA1/START domain